MSASVRPSAFPPPAVVVDRGKHTLSESVAAEFSAEIVCVADVPPGEMRLFRWPTGELQYGCRVAGGWVLSERLALVDLLRSSVRASLDREAHRPLFERMADDLGGDFEGDLVGGLIGCQDVTELAETYLAIFDVVEARR